MGGESCNVKVSALFTHVGLKMTRCLAALIKVTMDVAHCATAATIRTTFLSETKG